MQFSSALAEHFCQIRRSKPPKPVFNVLSPYHREVSRHGQSKSSSVNLQRARNKAQYTLFWRELAKRSRIWPLSLRIPIKTNFHSTGLCMGITMLSHDRKKIRYIRYYSPIWRDCSSLRPQRTKNGHFWRFWPFMARNRPCTTPSARVASPKIIQMRHL